MRDQRTGLCECGCGQATPLAPRTNRSKGWVEGQPLRFIRYHKRNKPGLLVPRLEAKIEFTDDHWLWRGAQDGHGYGQAFVFERGLVGAHVAVYELLIGPVPDGLELDHLCRTPLCVNPAHLEPVTHAENVRRGAIYVTHCPRGHEYTPENTCIGRKGERKCRACNRMSTREWRERQA